MYSLILKGPICICGVIVNFLALNVEDLWVGPLIGYSPKALNWYMLLLWLEFSIYE